MKQFSSYIRGAYFLMALSLLPCTIQAQENVKKAFNNFLSSKIDVNTKLSNQKDPATGRLISECNLYSFVAPSSKRNLIDDIYKAFEKDRNVGYWTLLQDANSPKQEIWNLVYGNNPSNYITLGDKKGYSVAAMNVLDGDYRYSYALEWREIPENESIVGTLMVLYGKRPTTSTVVGDEDSGVINWTINGEKFTLPYSKEKHIQMISDSILRNKIFKAQQKFSTANQSIITQDLGNTDSDLATQAWLSAFNSFKNMYMDDHQSTTRNTVVPQIVSLCKRADKGLTKLEKNLCIESLCDMKKQTKDKFQIGLLDEAIDYMK